MNDTKADMIVDVPVGLTAVGVMIVSQPAFDEIKKVAEDWSGAIPIECVVTRIQNGDVTAVQHVQWVMSNVRDVVYDLERGELRFTGCVALEFEHGHMPHRSWERSWYGDVDVNSYYQVILRDQVSNSVMYPIRNPHPPRPYC